MCHFYLSAVVLLAISPAFGDGWKQIPDAGGPLEAVTPEVVYDEDWNTLVLYSAIEHEANPEVWERQGEGWVLRKVGGADRLTDTAFVFDAKRHVAVLCNGSYVGGESDRAWRWDGVDWSGSAGPSPRTFHAMIYDSDRAAIVVFGGMSGDENLADTWEFDGTEWDFRSFGVPSARSRHAMTYDSARKVSLMYGGIGLLYDLWAWDGQVWTLLDAGNGAPGTPQNRFGHSMAFDTKRGRAMLFGGRTQGGESNDLWEWDGEQWSKVETPEAPPKRTDHAMVYDPDRHRLVLFGGQNAEGDWLSDTWEYALPEPPCYADLDRSGTLDFFDFLAFVNLFNSLDPGADCDASGGLDLFDFLCFVNAFNAGC